VIPGPEDPIERAAWTSGLVYGTLTVLIAIAGLGVAGGASPQGAGATILVGAVATWFAHAYASVLGHRATIHHHSAGEIGPALRHASSIVLAAIPAVIALAGASLGWWSSRAAIGFSNVAGIAVLAGAGWIVARAAGESVTGRLTATLVTASIGVGIVAVELVAHR
jgi:hypothetical protein